MENLKIMSLGAWCRPAYQARCFAQKKPEVEALKGPFDWTITSFNSLTNCLSPEFDYQNILNEDNLILSHARSGMCGKTGLIFHHAIGRKHLQQLGTFAKGERIPASEKLTNVLANAKGRFSRTFEILASLKSHAGPILFVRWRRRGHPDLGYPMAFEGETSTALLAVIEDFLGHKNFSVLSLESRIFPDQSEPLPDEIDSFQTDGRHVSILLKERKGFNRSWKGDEHSWDTAFNRTLSYLRQQKAMAATLVYSGVRSDLRSINALQLEKN